MTKKIATFLIACSISLAGCNGCSDSSTSVSDATVDTTEATSTASDASLDVDAASSSRCESFDSTVHPDC